MLKPMIQLYPVLPTKDEEERAKLRPVGRNRDLYQQTLVGWHDIIRAADDMGIWGAATVSRRILVVQTMPAALALGALLLA